MKINKKIAMTVSALTLSFSSFALESDYDKPIHVTSYDQHAQIKKNIVIFTHDVLLTQGSIKLTGDKLTVTRTPKRNHETMHAVGKVATFYQTQDDGKPFNAYANSIFYDVAKAKVTLIGNASVKQLNSEIKGSKIIYFLNTEELLVEGVKGKKQRVETVFLPVDFEDNKKTNK